jgi:hypothetical protein
MTTPTPRDAGRMEGEPAGRDKDLPGQNPDDSQAPVTSGDPGRGKVGVRTQPPGTKPNVPPPTPPDSAPD